ncbi:MAG TPA: M28 family peptidase [Kofleriaceae bacterium]|jgi:Tol biopolymer transport system component
MSFKGACLAMFVAACCPPKPTATVGQQTPVVEKPQQKDQALPEETHLHNMRQMTFGADNAEAYWAFGGDRLIMQTNHKPYACDQIEEMDAKTGQTKLVSTGKGRTTCSYFLKGDSEIIYASTHESSATCPTPPDMSKGYLWGLFDYDIYRASADGSNLRNLTPDTKGSYDAEATVCPVDGSIIFTSTRSGDLELWRMDSDGKNLKQLTNQPGYDGGAFFSADCSKIVWRSSRPTGEKLDEYKKLLAQNLVKPTSMDLYVANADGTDARQVTYLAGASFAPFFFPDGKRIIFSSNWQNPRSGEFDLFAINIDGTGLEQITFTKGFDGFPVFSPDGKTLAFSSNRRDVIGDNYRVTGTPAGEHDTNVYLADWVDHPAKAALPETAAADRIMGDIKFLADDAQEGRGVGTKGLEASFDRIQHELTALGVEPGNNDQWRMPFDVTTSVTRGATTALALDGKAVAEADWTPLASSGNGTVDASIVSVGYGMVDDALKLDDYKGKNVKGKIVLVNRFAPTTDSKLDAAAQARLGDLRFKAFTAKNKGAKAVIVVDNGDPTQEEAKLPVLSAAESEALIPIVVVTRATAASLGKGAHKAKITVALEPQRTKTGNLVGVIRAGAAQKQPGVLVIGAHVDHLGMGGPDALDPQVHEVHNGADDNASGAASLVEVARVLTAKKSELARDVYIVGFSAEEMGDLGSNYYAKNPPTKDAIVAMLNMDMVGRMRMGQLHVNGGDSATEWKGLVQPACTEARVDCTIGGSGYGPSDHMPFYVAGAPVLFFFTGNHLDYHTAHDDADRINAAGAARVAEIVAATALATSKVAKLTYVKAPPEMLRGGDMRRRGASLGTVPSYSEDPNQPKGVLLSDVTPDGAAQKAGLKGGDLITQIGTTEIGNVNDLMYVLMAAKPGEKTSITFTRNGKQQKVDATFGAARQPKPQEEPKK